MNTQDIKKILEMFDASTSVKLKITSENFEISLEKSGAKPAKAAIPQVSAIPSHISENPPLLTQSVESHDSKDSKDSKPENPPASTAAREIITSPMVGTFYRAPSPDSAPYVNVGDKVKKGQTIAIIEAMKIMNEIEAEFDCQIVEILATDAQSVEFSSELFAVEKI